MCLEDNFTMTESKNKTQKQEVIRKSGKHLFQKGQSGNPAGRPKGSIKEINELARTYTVEAIETTVSIMRDYSAKHADRLKAVSIILERGLGSPTNYVETKISNFEKLDFSFAKPSDNG